MPKGIGYGPASGTKKSAKKTKKSLLSRLAEKFGKK